MLRRVRCEINRELYGRVIVSTTMPTTKAMLMPEVKTNVHAKLKLRQKEQKFYYDVGSKSLKKLAPGDSVRMRLNNRWQPATVEHRDPERPRTYGVRTSEGRLFRRNRRDLFETKENIHQFRPDLDTFTEPTIPQMDIANAEQNTPIPPS